MKASSRPRSGPAAHVLFIRENQEQLSGGCAGHLEGHLLSDRPRDEGGFAERRRTIEELGPLYTAVQHRFGDAVQREILDPRNLLTVLIRVLSDVRRYGVPLGTAVRTVTGISHTSVIVNGRLFARGRWPAEEELVAHLSEVVAARD